MKLICSLMAFFLIHSATSGQTVLTAATHNPQQGDVYSVSNSNYVNPGNSGAGQIWDFSLAPVTGSSTYTVEASSSIALAASFPNANIAVTTGGVSDCFDANSNSLNYYGSTLTPGMLGAVYSNPETRLQFPFAYANTFSDSFYAAQTISSVNYFIYGTTTVTADGNGTLITPVGTYNNVLRVYAYKTWKDSTQGTVNNYTGNYYYWYSDTSRYPLAEMWTVNSTAGNSSGSKYFSGITQDILENALNDPFRIFPNPAGKKIFLQKENETEEIQLAELYDVNGKKIRVINYPKKHVDASCEFDLEKIESGVYFLEITSLKQTTIKKIIVE